MRIFFTVQLLQDLFGALRSTGTYIGAKTLKEFSRRATFIKVNRQLTDYLERFDQERSQF
jgi:IMP dehydrogenase/GMP reductase